MPDGGFEGMAQTGACVMCKHQGFLKCWSPFTDNRPVELFHACYDNAVLRYIGRSCFQAKRVCKQCIVCAGATSYSHYPPYNHRSLHAITSTWLARTTNFILSSCKPLPTLPLQTRLILHAIGARHLEVHCCLLVAELEPLHDNNTRWLTIIIITICGSQD